MLACANRCDVTQMIVSETTSPQSSGAVIRGRSSLVCSSSCCPATLCVWKTEWCVSFAPVPAPFGLISFTLPLLHYCDRVARRDTDRSLLRLDAWCSSSWRSKEGWSDGKYSFDPAAAAGPGHGHAHLAAAARGERDAVRAGVHPAYRV